MNALVQAQGSTTLFRMYADGMVRQMERETKRCFCVYHKGERVFTAKGILCNNEPFIVQLDSRGYHVLIGIAALDSEEFPEGVDAEELERIFKEALQ